MRKALVALILLALVVLPAGQGLPEGGRLTAPPSGTGRGGRAREDVPARGEFKRLKKLCKRLIAKRQRQGCDVSKACRLREQATRFRMEGRYGKAVKMLQAARLAAEQARPLENQAGLAAAAQRYGPLLIRFFEVKEGLDQLLRARRYGGPQSPDPSPVQVRLDRASRLLDAYEQAFHAAYTGTGTKPLLEQMEALAGKLEQGLAEAEQQLRPAMAALAGKGRKSARLKELAALTAARPRLEAGERLSKAQVGQRIIFGSAKLPAREFWPLVRPLGFEFMNVEVKLGQGAQPNFSMLDAQVRAAVALGCKAEVFVTLCPDKARKVRGWRGLTSPVIDIWDDGTRSRLKCHLKALGEHLRDNPAVLCYELWNEPQLAKVKVGKKLSEAALAAFRDYLKGKYGSAAELNRAWGSAYVTLGVEVKEPAGLQEYQLFRASFLAQLAGEFCAALQQADPNHPVMPQVYEWPPRRGVNAFAFAQQGWDIYSQHETGGGWPGKWNNLAQVYSLARFRGKPLWNEEYVWNAPEAAAAFKSNDAAGMLRAGEEMSVAAAARRDLWQQLAWGRRGFSFYSLDETWVDWENSILDRYHGYRILRRSAGAIPVLGERARRLSSLLVQTQVAQPEIGIVRSFESELGQRPGKLVRRQAKQVEKLLVRACLPYFIVPSEAIADGQEQLSNYSVLVLPMATHLPEAVSRRLLDWTAQGGLLIALGVPGACDGLGRPGVLAAQLLGGSSFQFIRGSGPKHWSWSVQIDPKAGHLKGRAVAGARLIQARRGKGRALIFTSSLFDGGNSLGACFTQEVEQRLRRHNVKVLPEGAAEAVLRRDSKGHEYLFLINLDAGSPAELTVRIERPTATVYDLGIEGLPQVPTVSRNGGSEAKVWLAPGDAAVLALD